MVTVMLKVMTVGTFRNMISVVIDMRGLVLVPRMNLIDTHSDRHRRVSSRKLCRDYFSVRVIVASTCLSVNVKKKKKKSQRSRKKTSCTDDSN